MTQVNNKVMKCTLSNIAENLSKTIHSFKDNGDKIPTKTLHSIMRQSAAAVKYLCFLQIVHCDIKPHNILYNR